MVVAAKMQWFLEMYETSHCPLASASQVSCQLTWKAEAAIKLLLKQFLWLRLQ